MAGGLRLEHKQASLEELGIPDTEASLTPEMLAEED
jgi:DNA-binding transcriptional regulator WhiA